MSLEFTQESKTKIDAVLAKYPNQMAATLPLLWIVQEQEGYVSDDAVQLVANTLELPASHVHGVVTFYTMYNREPKGKLHIQVCTNVACMLRGAYDVLKAFEKKCGVKAGQAGNTDYTVQEVECLAACGTAPCVQINEDYYEPVLPEDVGRVIEEAMAAAKAKPSSAAKSSAAIEKSE